MEVNVMDNVAEEPKVPEKEELLANEDVFLKNVLEAANFENDESLNQKITIKRGDKVMFSFTVHPLSSEQIEECRKTATKTYKNPQGRHLPRIEGDTDMVKFRAQEIYEATVEDDKRKLWENKKIQNKLNVFLGVDVITKVLMAGEIASIVNIIDSISKYDTDEDDYISDLAKN